MLLLCATAFVACHKAAKPSNFESVDVEQFQTIIQDSTVQCVDVRSESEHQEGHIAGSINIDVLKPNFASHAERLLNKEQTVAIYCRSGKRSKKAGAILSEMGFQVVELNVGYNGWVEQTK